MQIRLRFRINELQLPKEKVSEGPYIGQIQEQSSLNCGTRHPNNVERVICCCGHFVVSKKQHDASFVYYDVALYSNSVRPAYDAELLAPGRHAAGYVDPRKKESTEVVTSLQIRQRLLASIALQC